MILPEWLFQEPIENENEKINNPKSLKQIARDNIKLDDKQLNKELAKRMLIPSYFTDKNLKVGFKINLDSHHIIHANSTLTITPKYPEFGIEDRYSDKKMKDLAVIYARLINQYKFKYQTVFSTRFDKEDEDNQVLDETELFININIIHNLIETDIDKTDVRSPIHYQIQQQEMKDSRCRFDEVNSMIVYSYKTGELDDSNYVKNPLRSNSILSIGNIDKHCSLWLIVAYLHPCINNHLNRVSNYKQFYNKLNITNGSKCSDVHKFNELNKLSINIFELKIYQDQNKWRHKLIPVEVNKNTADRVIDLLNYENHHALIKKLNAFLGDHYKTFICR